VIAAIHPLSRSFKVPVRYAEVGRDGRQSRVAWAETYNLPTRDLELAACFMGATANGSVSGTRTAVYFFSVSFDIDDPVDEAMMGRVARRTLRDMGLEEHEAVVVAHKDRSHPHLHFIVNRVHPTRFVLWRKWWDYGRMERSLRAQEVELGLRVVPGRHAPVPSLERTREGHTEGWQPGARWIKPLPGPKRGDPGFLQDVTERAAPILARVRSWGALESGLTEQGLALTVKGGGSKITDGKHPGKGVGGGPFFSRCHPKRLWCVLGAGGAGCDPRHHHCARGSPGATQVVERNPFGLGHPPRSAFVNATSPRSAHAPRGLEVQGSGPGPIRTADLTLIRRAL
jgi:hypothetical protein